MSLMLIQFSISKKIMKRNIFFILGLVLMVALSSCSKGKFCKCTALDGVPDIRIVNVDWGISCKSITEMGVERQVLLEGEKEPTLIREMRKFDCVHVKEEDANY